VYFVDFHKEKSGTVYNSQTVRCGIKAQEIYLVFILCFAMGANKRKSGEMDARREDDVGPLKLGETTLPLARVRRLIKAQDDVHYVSAEASFLVSRATELFLELMTEAGVKRIGSRVEPSLQYADLGLAPLALIDLAMLCGVSVR